MSCDPRPRPDARLRRLLYLGNKPYEPMLRRVSGATTSAERSEAEFGRLCRLNRENRVNRPTFSPQSTHSIQSRKKRRRAKRGGGRSPPLGWKFSARKRGMYRRRPRRRLGKRAKPAPAPRQRRDRIPPSEARRKESREAARTPGREAKKSECAAQRRIRPETRRKHA